LQQRCACWAGAEAELSEKVASAEAELQTVRSDCATSQSARDWASSELLRCKAARRALREELLELKEDKAFAEEVAAASRGYLGNVFGQLQEKEEGRAAVAAQVRDLQRHPSELAAERVRLAIACESAAWEQHAARDRVGEIQVERASLLTRLVAWGTMSQDEGAKQEGQLSSLLGKLSAAKVRAEAWEKDRGVLAEEVRKERKRAEDVSAAAEKYAAAQVEVESLRSSQRSTQQHQELLTQICS
jgi:chromosome segregation ATPase